MGIKKGQSGFTLVEIVVATTIFAIVFSSLLSLYNYVLKINRRSEALRQASQGMRSFVEFLVKEIRNGQIDYYVSNGQYVAKISGTSPCAPVGSIGTAPKSTDPGTYSSQDNKLGIINTDNVQECFYFGKSDGSYAGTSNFTAPANANYTLVMEKAGIPGQQILNPPNYQIKQLMFLVRPLCDPKTANGCNAYTTSSGYPDVQPSVAIFIQFVAQLPTGEQVPIYYQTSVSSDKYDIPQ